jgi:hypothetical protein
MTNVLEQTEIFPCGVTLFRGILTDCVCDTLVKRIDDKHREILQNPLFKPTRYVNEKRLQKVSQNGLVSPEVSLALDNVLEKLENNPLSVRKQCTVSKHTQSEQIGWHFDLIMNKYDLYKICMYISNSSGTIFRKPDGVEFEVSVNKGDCIVFPLTLEHCGSPVTGDTKYLLGFRAGTDWSKKIIGDSW